MTKQKQKREKARVSKEKKEKGEIKKGRGKRVFATYLISNWKNPWKSIQNKSKKEINAWKHFLFSSIWMKKKDNKWYLWIPKFFCCPIYLTIQLFSTPFSFLCFFALYFCLFFVVYSWLSSFFFYFNYLFSSFDLLAFFQSR